MSADISRRRRSGRRQQSINGAASSDRVQPHVNGAASGRRRAPPKSRGAGRARLLPSFHSEQTREVVLQRAVGKRSDRITLAYHSPDVAFDLSARGATLLSGTIESRLAVDGVELLPRGDWQSVCWYGDEDGDYLELQLCLSDSVRIDRQVLLSRRDHFAFLADAVIAPQARTIEYRCSLPLSTGVTVKAAAATRELRLRGPGCVARVFPLALPQGRVLSTPGSCLEREGRLDVEHASAGGALYVPVLFDWHPRRGGLQADWRTLTVSELGRAVAPHQAAAFRLRLGTHQLLIYKNLDGSREARAVLGQHTRYETIVGNFDAAGDVDPVILVETE